MIDFCTVVVLDFELKIVYLRANLLHKTCRMNSESATTLVAKIHCKTSINK